MWLWYVYIYIHKYTVCENTCLYIFKYVCIYTYHEYVAMYVLQVCFVTWYTSTPCLQSFSGQFCTLRFTSHDGCLPREILGHDSTITLVEVMLQSKTFSSASGNLPLCISERFIFPCSLPESTLKIGAWKMKIPSQAPPEDGEGSNEARSEEKGNKNHRELGQTSCVFMCFLLS